MRHKYDNLKEQAIALGACEEGIANWGKPTLMELCTKYFKYQDFCIQHNWPSAEQLAGLDKRILKKSGIYVANKAIANGQSNIAVVGSAEVSVLVKQPCNITVRHNGKVRISLDSDVLCYISAHDDCTIEIVRKNPNGRIAMSYWGGEIVGKEYVDKIYNKTK